jgi:predicted dehydrogenase
MYRQEHSAFLRAISGASSPSSPPEEAIASMEIIDAAMRSLESGTRVGLAGE